MQNESDDDNTEGAYLTELDLKTNHCLIEPIQSVFSFRFEVIHFIRVISIIVIPIRCRIHHFRLEFIKFNPQRIQ